MNKNMREVEFRRNDERIEMWVERDSAPFDDYLCGEIIEHEDGYYRFHPTNGVSMHCKLLREVVEELSRLNTES